MRKIGIVFSLLFLSLLFSQFAQAETYGSISGKVTGEDTGKGVAGVGVNAFLHGERRQAYAKTDAKGIYILKDLKSGIYLIHFDKKDSPYIFEEVGIEVVLPRGKNVINANYTLKLGGSVAGTVYDADGVTPLSDVSVFTRIPDLPEGISGFRSSLTDNSGRYILRGLPETSNCKVMAELPGRGILTKTVKIVKGKTIENIKFVVKAEVTGVTGFVRSSLDNKPLIGSLVSLEDNLSNDIGYDWTDETGKYSILGVTPGLYKIVVFGPKSFGWVEKTNVLVEPGKSTTVNFEFNVPPPKSKTEK